MDPDSILLVKVACGFVLIMSCVVARELGKKKIKRRNNNDNI